MFAARGCASVAVDSHGLLVDSVLIVRHLAPSRMACILSNQARSKLTEAGASSVSLAQLRAYERQLTAANGPVEEAVGVIRSRLGLPRPDTS